MFDKVENVLFANSLIGTIIQDGGKRGRSVLTWPCSVIIICDLNLGNKCACVI